MSCDSLFDVSDDKPLGQRNYEQFASRYAKHAATKPHNAGYERPATLSLLPRLDGVRVLDAGCGPGLYAKELVDRGADVVAVDVTPQMIERARATVGERATFHVADLSQPLSFAADRAFEGIVSALVLDYIDDWEPVFAEFFRVLEPGGWLVYSHSHPMSDYLLLRDKVCSQPRYFDRERFSMRWSGFGEPKPLVETNRRPLAQMINPLVRAGFVLEELLEPLPIPSVEQSNPALFESLSREPCFLCVRARKPPAK